MRYIARSGTSFDLVPYEDYLDRERVALEARIGGRALLVIERFVPRGPESFHDARFRGFSVDLGGGDGQGAAEADGTAELRLKGPYFDREFRLDYSGVIATDIRLPSGDDDLLMHEVRLEGQALVHELVFEGEGLIEIRCARMHFREQVDEASASEG